MRRSVLLTARARQDLTAIEPKARQRIVTALERFAETDVGAGKFLAGADPAWRLHVGDWRVRFTYTPSDDGTANLVWRVLNRRDSYRA